MKTLAMLLLSLAVALGVPAPPPAVPQNPVLAEEGDPRPLLGDVLPVQGHMVAEDPAPQLRLGSQEEKEKVAPAPMDVQQGPSTVWTEVKEQPEVKEVKAEAEVKVEPEVKEVKAEAEVKVEPEVKEVKAEAEVKEEPEVKEVKAEAEVKVEPEVKEVKPEAEVKVEPEVKEVKTEAEVKVEPEVKEVKAEAEVKVEPEVNAEAEEIAPELEENPDFKLESEEKVAPEVMAKLEVNENPEAEMEPDVEGEPEPEEEPMVDEDQAAPVEYQVQMSLEDEPEPESERHIDMEGRYGVMPEPIMELEPEDDDNMFGGELGDTELSNVENSLRGAFRNEEGYPEDRFLETEPIMELEPLDEEMFGEEPSNIELAEEEKSIQEAFQSGDPAIQSLLEEEGLEADAEFERHIDMEGKNEMAGETTMELEDDGSMIGDELSNATRGSYCPGVIHEGKCYQFFRGPKRAADAEFFCQDRFPGGHLASITSQYIHLKLMKLILDQNGSCTRTWVGGLRYLDTDRFIWLDGSRWNYADWLRGEPNNTSNKEDCLEVLSCTDGTFNDFTCWESQTFICSYTAKESQM